jgi:hypothetical protein
MKIDGFFIVIKLKIVYICALLVSLKTAKKMKDEIMFVVAFVGLLQLITMYNVYLCSKYLKEINERQKELS